MIYRSPWSCPRLVRPLRLTVAVDDGIAKLHSLHAAKLSFLEVGGDPDLVEILERLPKVVVGSLFDGAQRALGGSVARHHHDLRVGQHLLDVAHEVEAVAD